MRKLPRGYRRGYYAEILQIRRESREVQYALEALRSCDESGTNTDLTECYRVMCILLETFPLLENEHLQEYTDTLEIVKQKFHPKQLETTILLVTDFLHKQSVIAPISKLYMEDYDSGKYQPIRMLDILYTIRSWHSEAPFNCISEYLLSRAEKTIFKWDLKEFYLKMAWSKGGTPSDSIIRYIRRRDRYKVCLRRMLGIYDDSLFVYM